MDVVMCSGGQMCVVCVWGGVWYTCSWWDFSYAAFLQM